MKLVAVVAADENNVSGVDGDLPWRLPNDLKHFKAVTLGHPILMGRKTYDSIGRALPGRQNLVLTRQPARHDEVHRLLQPAADVVTLHAL